MVATDARRKEVYWARVRSRHRRPACPRAPADRPGGGLARRRSAEPATACPWSDAARCSTPSSSPRRPAPLDVGAAALAERRRWPSWRRASTCPARAALPAPSRRRSGPRDRKPALPASPAGQRAEHGAARAALDRHRGARCPRARAVPARRLGRADLVGRARTAARAATTSWRRTTARHRRVCRSRPRRRDRRRHDDRGGAARRRGRASVGACSTRWSSGRAVTARSTSCSRCAADNAAARGSTRQAGFELLTMRRRYYQPGDVDALRHAADPDTERHA